MNNFLILIFTLSISLPSFSGETKIIPEGRFAPLYGLEKDQKDFKVSSFRLDVHPVNINKIPVVKVTWFEANAYCESKKGRLPTTLEWEYVAAASEKMRDAQRDSVFVQKILDWYSRPESEASTKKVGKDNPNFYGIHNMHGLNWEWTSDFNSVLMTNDNRSDGDKESGKYCGFGSIGSKTKEDYAAFIRYSLRSSLEARFKLENLGFRCAYDL